MLSQLFPRRAAVLSWVTQQGTATQLSQLCVLVPSTLSLSSDWGKLICSVSEGEQGLQQRYLGPLWGFVCSPVQFLIMISSPSQCLIIFLCRRQCIDCYPWWSCMAAEYHESTAGACWSKESQVQNSSCHLPQIKNHFSRKMQDSQSVDWTRFTQIFTVQNKDFLRCRKT